MGKMSGGECCNGKGEWWRVFSLERWLTESVLMGKMSCGQCFYVKDEWWRVMSYARYVKESDVKPDFRDHFGEIL